MRWDLVEYNGYICIRKRNGGNYGVEHIRNICRNHKYLYKASSHFKLIYERDFIYSKYILSDIYIERDIFDWLNNLNVFDYLNNLINVKSFYNIKEKIEIL